MKVFSEAAEALAFLAAALTAALLLSATALTAALFFVALFGAAAAAAASATYRATGAGSKKGKTSHGGSKSDKFEDIFHVVVGYVGDARRSLQKIWFFCNAKCTSLCSLSEEES